jgi:hypothetical protein
MEYAVFGCHIKVTGVTGLESLTLLHRVLEGVYSGRFSLDELKHFGFSWSAA